MTDPNIAGVWASEEAEAAYNARVSRPRRALKPDAQPFDRIVIETVPRYKESELSGDEWRISAVVKFYRKGIEVHSFGCRNVEVATVLVGAELLRACDDAKGFFGGEGHACDQEGCYAEASWRHTLKAKYDRSGNRSEIDAPGEYRLFCERHKTRGDCGLEDADSNYIVEPYVPGGAHMTQPHRIALYRLTDSPDPAIRLLTNDPFPADVASHERNPMVTRVSEIEVVEFRMLKEEVG